MEVPISSEGGNQYASASASPFSRILVPIDGSDASINAAHVAVRMAAVHSLPIIAVYVIDDKSVDEMVSMSGESVENVRRQLESKGRRYLDHVASIAKRFGVQCTRVVRRGIPHAQIADIVRDRGIDLVVLGRAQPQSARRAFIGSTTEHVIDYVPCSVMVVKQR